MRSTPREGRITMVGGWGHRGPRSRFDVTRLLTWQTLLFIEIELTMVVQWYSDRTLIFDRRTFPVLRLTYS